MLRQAVGFMPFVFLAASSALQAQECFQWRDVVRATEEWYYPRYESVAFDSIRKMTVVVGGYDGSYHEPNETWGWDGAEWHLLVLGGMPGRSFASAAFDRDRGRMVVFGGRGMDNVAHGPLHGDTWEWDGAEWSLRAESGPLPRWGHCMAYDDKHRVTLMFGGEGEYGLFGTLWAWDGVTWTLLSGEGPPPRSHFACAFDSHRGVFVIFGGDQSDYDNEYGGDTWEWNGASWRPAADSFVGLTYAAMAFDEARGVAILHGGMGGDPTIVTGDVLAWDGLQWTGLQAPQRPHFAHSMVYDSTRDRIVVLGGIWTEQWLFELMHVDEAADADSDCDADLFDFATLQECAGAMVPGSECVGFDADENGIIDAADFAEWAYSFSGPGE